MSNLRSSALKSRSTHSLMFEISIAHLFIVFILYSWQMSTFYGFLLPKTSLIAKITQLWKVCITNLAMHEINCALFWQLICQISTIHQLPLLTTRLNKLNKLLMTDRWTNRQTLSIHRPELLYNLAKKNSWKFNNCTIFQISNNWIISKFSLTSSTVESS